MRPELSDTPDIDVVLDEVLACVGPSKESLQRRLRAGSYLKSLIISALSDTDYQIRVANFGSVPLRTFLPDSDNDIAVIARSRTGALLPEAPCDELLDVVSGFLDKHMSKPSRPSKSASFRISSVSLIPSRVRVLKVVMTDTTDNNPLSLDVSINKIAGSHKLPLLETIDAMIGRRHLFKRSLLLLKAWAHNEQKMLGSSKGLLASYALEVMLMAVFAVSDRSSLIRPIHVFSRFMEIYTHLDFASVIITANGFIQKHLFDPESQMTGTWLGSFAEWFSYDNAPYYGNQNTHTFLYRSVNISDPLCPWNNLGCSVSQESFGRLRFCLASTFAEMRKVLVFKDADRLRRNFQVSLGEDEDSDSTDDSVSREFLADLLGDVWPLKRANFDIKQSVSTFTVGGYSILRSDPCEIAWNFLSAHPDHNKLEDDLQVYTKHLISMRRRPKVDNKGGYQDMQCGCLNCKKRNYKRGPVVLTAVPSIYVRRNNSLDTTFQ